MRAHMMKQEPDQEQEQDIAADSVQEAINGPEADPYHDEQEQVIAVDNTLDQTSYNHVTTLPRLKQ